MPLCVTGYFLLNRFKAEAANVFLLGMSLWFYGYLNPNYLAIICSSIVINYLLCLMMRRFGKETSAQGRRKGILILGILINLGILGYFKYADFFISNFNAVFRKDVGLLRIALPLGISFFTFQQISYVVDTYHDSASATDFITYACYVSFFPQLVAGPIVTQDEFLPQFQNPRNRKVNWDNVAHGSYLFVLGLAKKVMIADIFGQVVETGYTVIPDLNSPSAMFLIFSYTMQIYFDFSGYCDMAMGIGKMFNVELPVNFDSPYRAIGIADFWKRWHVTLTRFFTKYVYIPLGGSQKGQVRTYVNVMIIFLLSGLWHGANWTYVFWGGLHGIAMVMARLWKNQLEKVPKLIRWAACFLFFNATLVFFRATSFAQAFAIFGRVFRGGFGKIPLYFTACFVPKAFEVVLNRLPGGDAIPGILTAAFVIAISYITFFTDNAREQTQKGKLGTFRAILAAALLTWCILSFENISVFLYFNF